jgi:hypothetical protein
MLASVMNRCWQGTNYVSTGSRNLHRDEAVAAHAGKQKVAHVGHHRPAPNQ